MSKGLKFCLVLGIACVILGGGIAGAAVAMGADRSAGIAMWNLSNHWENGWDDSWNDSWNEIIPGNTDEIEADYGDAYAGINELEINFAAGNIMIESGGEDSIQIWSDSDDYYRWSVSENTLKVNTSKKNIGYDNQKHTLHIRIPEGWIFHEVDIDMAAGNFYAEELYAGSLDIDMAAGNVEIGSGKIGELAVDMTAGRILCQAAVQHELDIDMTAGHANVLMLGEETDYNYEITCAMGNIDIGNSSYSGMRQKKEINNHSERDIDIDCAAGNVTISFAE